MEFKIDPDKLDAIFFDVGNTLFKPYPSLEAICIHVLGQFGYEVDKDQLRRGLIEADHYYEKRYWEDDTFWTNEEDASRIWAEMYARMLEVIGIDGYLHRPDVGVHSTLAGTTDNAHDLENNHRRRDGNYAYHNQQLGKVETVFSVLQSLHRHQNVPHAIVVYSYLPSLPGTSLLFPPPGAG